MYFENAKLELIEALFTFGISVNDGVMDEHRPRFYKRNIVLQLFPFLADMIDDDGLIPVSDLYKAFLPIEGTCFIDRAVEFMPSQKTPFAIMLHPYFRRSISRYNNFYAPFIDALYFANKKEKLNLKIRIDLDCITISKYAQRVQEREYWYGAKFTPEIPNNPEGVIRYSSSSRETLYNGSTYTDFYWKNKDCSHIQLEIEQVHNNEHPNIPNNLFGCKYLHTVYNKDSTMFEHFDGAIRAYTKEEIDQRHSVNLSKLGRVGQYTKIFRIDGAIPFDTWKELIQLFMTYNESIPAYFSGK